MTGVTLNENTSRQWYNVCTPCIHTCRSVWQPDRNISRNCMLTTNSFHKYGSRMLVLSSEIRAGQRDAQIKLQLVVIGNLMLRVWHCDWRTNYDRLVVDRKNEITPVDLIELSTNQIDFHRVWGFTIADLAFLSPLGASFNFYVIDSCGIPWY